MSWETVRMLVVVFTMCICTSLLAASIAALASKLERIESTIADLAKTLSANKGEGKRDES